MAHQVRLLNKFSIIILFCLLSCSQETHTDLKLINAEGLSIRSSKGLTYVNDTLFSGRIYSLYKNTSDTASIERYLDGKEHGTWEKWFPDHSMQEIRRFENGKKVGKHISYWPNGQMKFFYHLENDIYHGNNKEWMPDGQLTADMNYEYGQEVGSQKAWYSNGKIKANYFIKNSRRYGLLGTKNCTNVSDSVFTN